RLYTRLRASRKLFRFSRDRITRRGIHTRTLEIGRQLGDSSRSTETRESIRHWLETQQAQSRRYLEPRTDHRGERPERRRILGHQPRLIRRAILTVLQNARGRRM